MAANVTGSGALPILGAAHVPPVTMYQVLLVVFLGYLAVNRYQYWARTPKVMPLGFAPLPFIGPWIGAVRFLRNPNKLVREGMAKSKNGLLRIATIQGEYVLVTDRHKVAEYLKAPDSVLNAQDGSNDRLALQQQQIPFTMGYGIGHRTYHTAVVRGPITQSINAWTPLLDDECGLAFDDLIRCSVDYEPISLYDTIAITVGRMANRIYVGTEFCRNEEYLTNAADYAQAVVITAELIRPFPDWLKHILIRFMPVMRHRKKGESFLRTFIQERLDGKLDEFGQKPTDLVQRLIDAAPPIEKTVPQLAERVMALNVASIHTTTMTFTSALYSLAAEPEKYAEVLRNEVLEHLEDGQITAGTLASLPKMDSFLRESGRFNNAGLMAMQRNARKEFKFSDGTVIPPGAKVGAVTLALQRDPEVFENPDVFDGFRFYQAEPSETKPSTMVNTGTNFHLFGHGRHPCPGRFLAVHEMKIMFAKLLLRYDWKLAPGTKPEPFFIATMPGTLPRVSNPKSLDLRLAESARIVSRTWNCGNESGLNAACGIKKISSEEPHRLLESPRSNLSPGPPQGLDVSSLELLHNFTTRTFATLSESLILRDFYRITAVQLGLQCEYVMRTLLAVSALHLAYHRPDMRDHYQSLGMAHHQVATRDAMAVMADPSPATAETLFLFSSVTIHFALACPRKNDGPLFIEESGFPEWMFLLQGTRAFMRITGTQSSGLITPLLSHGTDRWLARQSNPEPTSRGHQYLDSMRSLISLRQSDVELRNIYIRAIDELQKSFSVFEGAGSEHCDLTDAFVWIFEVAEDLLPLLRVPTQEAVAVFAFFAVLLKRLEKHWYLRGWADHLIAKSYDLLDEEHRLWIQWPLEETGWIPSGRP
ncbi:hypothetical protein JX265_013300 [Neoarthrinium moseri]|uniref:Cytochrome P450 n=1 Tax=Neoarthrinium moseri TaxID=1658444 RepID=A0A9P9W8K8_9PEZI|nr:hypothetical protein JX265_013300 [Neoarthrinium moseri]